MKNNCILSLLAASTLMLPSCMTTYDAYGRQVQSVDPGLAAVGIIGAGLLGAAIANSNDSHRETRHVEHHNYTPQPQYTQYNTQCDTGYYGH